MPSTAAVIAGKPQDSDILRIKIFCGDSAGKTLSSCCSALGGARCPAGPESCLRQRSREEKQTQNQESEFHPDLNL